MGRACFFSAGGPNFCRASVPFHQWSHVVGVNDGVTMKLCVNGAMLHKRGVPPGKRIASGRTVFIGGKGESAYYNGLIRDVRVYARVLSEREIPALAVANEANASDVEVSVTLKEGDPLSRWRIKVTNRSRDYGLWNVVFPVLRLKPIGRNERKNSLSVPALRTAAWASSSST